MTTSDLLHRAQHRLATLTPKNLRIADDFLAWLEDRESAEATEELLAIPGLLAHLREAEEDVRAGRLTPVSELRAKRANADERAAESEVDGTADLTTRTVAQMSTLELRELIAEVVEEKLLELLPDPDEGLELQPAVRDRLLSQSREIAAGERGRDFDEVMRELG